MTLCQEIGQWIEENVEQPVEHFFEQAQQVCDDFRDWVEHEVRDPVTRYREEQQKVCEEQDCNWWCACCNKWLCWFITVVTTFVEWVITIVGEWIITTICNIIVTIIRFIVMAIIHILTWVVLFVICFLEALCGVLLFMGALALVILLLAVAAQGAPLIAAFWAPIIPVAFAVVVTCFFMARFLCRIDCCRIVNAVGWAFKWAILIGMGVAIYQFAPMMGWWIAIYGGLLSALIIALEKGKCRLKSMRELP